MPLAPNTKERRGFRSFILNLLDLPDDDQVQRLIHSQLITSTAPNSISNSQAYLRYQPNNADQATSSILVNNPPFKSVDRTYIYKSKTADQHLAPSQPRTGTGEQVQFASNNQNSVYCVSSVNLSRLAFEEQSAGRASSSAGAVQIAGSTQFAGVPTPTQLTIATELPTATKFTTRPASFIDKQQRPIHIMHKKKADFFDLNNYDDHHGMALCAVVQEYERAVIFRLGRLLKGGAKGPGIFFIIPCIDTYSKVDLRTVSFDVPPQEILSKDSVTVAVDAVVYFRINNAIASVSNVEDYARSTRLLAATTLRNVLGTKNLSEILSERESISHMIQSSLDEATESWGVKVERVEIKDVRLPVQLQRAMAAEAEATREARAKVIAAEGEQRASRALKEAAEVISDSPAALQLRYLQTLSSIAAENNSTIVFPVPMELFRGFIHDDYHEDGNNGQEKHSHHHHHHHSSHHSNHHLIHTDQQSDCEEYENKPTNCGDNLPFNQYESGQTNQHMQQILTAELNQLANFNADEYLGTDLESPVPKYKE